jgi:hypothetical protein
MVGNYPQFPLENPAGHLHFGPHCHLGHRQRGRRRRRLQPHGPEFEGAPMQSGAIYMSICNDHVSRQYTNQ